MIKSKLGVAWTKGEPTIYCIFYSDYIYIGITEDLPFTRWNGHFKGSASFLKAIKNRIPDFDYQEEEIIFVAITIERSSLASTKDLQALEKLLHTSIDCNPFISSRGFITISSTKCTAPRKYNYGSLKSKVAKIRKEIEELFSQSQSTY